MQFGPGMPPTLRVVRSDERFERAPPAVERAPPRWFWLVAGVMAFGAVVGLIWTSATADTRALRALPDDVRVALYARTIQNLRGTCDPAPPRSLREFCREQAALAAKFQECDAAPGCQELVRRHLFQPHR
jgi:hypothetical protein